MDIPHFVSRICRALLGSIICFFKFDTFSRPLALDRIIDPRSRSNISNAMAHIEDPRQRICLSGTTRKRQLYGERFLGKVFRARPDRVEIYYERKRSGRLSKSDSPFDLTGERFFSRFFRSSSRKAKRRPCSFINYTISSVFSKIASDFSMFFPIFELEENGKRCQKATAVWRTIFR